MIKLDLDGLTIPLDSIIVCPSFTSDIVHKIYIHDLKLKCTCYAYKFYHNRDGGYCKHIRLLAETILRQT